MIGQAAVCVSEFVATLSVPFAEKPLDLFHLGTAGWLLYLTWPATLNVAAGYHLMVWLLPRQGAGPGLNAPCSTAPIRIGDRPIATRCCGGVTFPAHLLVSTNQERIDMVLTHHYRKELRHVP